MTGSRPRTASAGRAIAAMATIAAAGCVPAVESALPDGFAPSAAFLAAAADASTHDPYRFAVSVQFTEGATSVLGPDVSGAFDGERTHVVVDFSAIESDRDLRAGLDGDDLVVETITDERMLYARSPLFGARVAEADIRWLPPSVTEIAEALGAGWMSVDVGDLEDVDPAWAASVLAGQRTDPTVYLDLVRDIDRVDELGRDTIDGETVHGLGGRVSSGDLLRLRQPADNGHSHLEPLDEVVLPIEVWVDGDGDIRRIELTEDIGEATRALVAAGLLPPTILADVDEHLVAHQTIELWDHGDESIAVDVPTDARDMTEAYRAFLLDTGALPDPDRSDRDLAGLEQLYGDIDTGLVELDPPPGPPPGPSEAEMEAQLEELEKAYQEIEAWDDIPPPPPPPPPVSVPELPEIPPMPELPELPPIPEIPHYES